MRSRSPISGDEVFEASRNGPPRFGTVPALLICLFIVWLNGCGHPDLDSDDPVERRDAMDHLVFVLEDQQKLAEVALDDRDGEFATRAAAFMTDQALLQKVAVGSAWYGARSAAFLRLESPSTLALLLCRDRAKAVPFVVRQTDEAFLREVSAICDRGYSNYSATWDEKGAVTYRDFFEQRMTQEWRNCGIIAALELSLDDPVIRDRLGGLELAVDRSERREAYVMSDSYGYRARAGAVIGETITLRIQRAASGSPSAAPLCRRSFTTDFPPSKTASDNEEFVAAELSSVAVLSELLRRAEFTSEDLRTVATGGTVSDLRASAVSLLDDQALLATIARQDPSPQVRFMAVTRLQTQEILYQIAMNRHEKYGVRLLAASRVTDDAFSRKLARRSTDSAIRELNARDR